MRRRIALFTRSPLIVESTSPLSQADAAEIRRQFEEALARGVPVILLGPGLRVARSSLMWAFAVGLLLGIALVGWLR